MLELRRAARAARRSSTARVRGWSRMSASTVRSPPAPLPPSS